MLLYRNQVLWNLTGIMPWEINSPAGARDNRECKAMVVQNCLRAKMHPEIVECNKPKDWEESAELREYFSCHWLLVDQHWGFYLSFRSSEKHFSTFPLPFFHCYLQWTTLPPPASPSAPDADSTDTRGTQTPPSMGCLHCMHPLAGGFPLTHRGFALEQNFVSGQSFNSVTSLL